MDARAPNGGSLNVAECSRMLLFGFRHSSQMEEFRLRLTDGCSVHTQTLPTDVCPCKSICSPADMSPHAH